MLSERWRTFQELLITPCGTFEDCFSEHLRTLWGPFDDHLRNFWRPQDFEDVDNVLRNWDHLEYLLWTSEDFEGFDDLLRNLRTFWGSVENLRSEDLGYLLCIFFTFWGLSGPFEEFWKTWGPYFLRTLKNLSGLLMTLKLLRTWCLWGLQWLFRTLRILNLKTLRTEDFEIALTFCGPMRTSRAFITFWEIWGHFEDQLRTFWGPWVPFVHFLDFLRTLWTFWGIFKDLRTWCSQNIEEPFWNFWWLLVDHLRTVFRKFWVLFEDHLLSIWGTFDDHRILTTLITSWGLWCRLEYLLWTYEDFEGFDNLLRNLRTFLESVENLRSEDLGYLLCIFLTFWGLSEPFEEFWKTWGPDFLRTLKNLSGTFEDYNDFSGHWGFCEPDYLLRTLRTLINIWGLWNRLEYVLWTYEDFEGFYNLLRNLRPFWGSVENLRSEDLGYLLCIFLTFWGLCGPFEDFLKTWGPDALRTLKNLSGTFDDFLWTIWGLFLGNFEYFLRII